MKYILIILILLFSNFFNSQVAKWKIDDIVYLNEIAYSKKNKNNDWKQLKEKLSIYSINNIDYISVLGKLNKNFEKKVLESEGFIVGTIFNGYFTCKIPIEKINFISNYKGIDYIEISSKVKLNIDQAVKDIGADSVQNGYNLPQKYTGKDVYIGITDWGFDYTHPQFYDTLLQENRIHAAWDQYKQSGNHPNNFNYGVEYQGVDELLNAKSDTANVYSYHYHGSHVAGICAGSGGGTQYRGVAIDAKYLFASFLIDAASVIDAYEWMYQKASQDQKRLVINQSWGLHHFGTLDGSSILSQAINYYSDLGVVFVTSGGNNGDVSFHIKKTFNNDTIITRINFYDYSFPTMWGQSVTLWGEENKSFKVSMSVLGQTNNVIYKTAFYSSSITNYFQDSLIVINNDTIIFNVTSENSNVLNNRPHIRWRVKNKSPNYKIVMQMTAEDGVLHAWNVVELTNDVGNWGMSFSKVYSYYTAGDRYYGIGEPACSKNAIAVAAYQTYGNLAPFSSNGPTLDERVKPDIAAPGVNIVSSISSYTDNNFNLFASVNFNGRDYPYSKLSGTSMSCPVVTGVVALMLEANPYLSAVQVKNILQESARTDQFTGVIPAEYSNKWGAGKVNAYKSVQLALQTIGNVSINEDKNKRNSILIVPNPCTDYIKLNENIFYNNIQIIDENGRVIPCKLINNVINISEFQSGAYIFRCQIDNKIVQEKFIKN